MATESRDGADERRYGRLAAPVVAAAILVHLSMHYLETDKSGNFVEADYATSILHGCPPHAVLAVRSQVTVTLWYRQFVRNDVHDSDLSQVSPLFTTKIGEASHDVIAVSGKDGLLRLLDRNTAGGVPPVLLAPGSAAP